MTQPYAMPYRPQHQPVPVLPQYRPLRAAALVSIALMGLTAVAAIIQCVLLWRSYDEVKRFVYGLLSDEEIERGIASIAGSGPFLNLLSYLLIGTAIAFLVWLWRARENVDFLYYPFAPYPTAPPQQLHRRSSGWVIGSWFCPIVQFWYPLQVVTDVVRASEPPNRPGAARTGQVRALLSGWWATWTAFWVIIVGGGSAAAVGFVIWIVRLLEISDGEADRPYVDLYDLQDYMVNVALAVDIGFTIATVLLIAAGAAIALVMLQVGNWQQERFEPPKVPLPPPQTPQYAPRPAGRGDFPTYSP